jgi:DUF971 family protein/molybdopterin converting factor small subunit
MKSIFNHKISITEGNIRVGQEDNQPVQVPTGIKLHKGSRYLEVIYPNGDVYKLPCEYLRAFPPAAEEKISRNKDVNISAINPVGSYALQIVFDDGHETGIYSWATLYDMSVNMKRDWEDHDSVSKEDELEDEGERTITILYFAALVKRLELDNETITLPEDVVTIGDLVPWLMTRGGEWKRALAGNLKITVNRQFSDMSRKIHDDDEVALVLVAEENIR